MKSPEKIAVTPSAYSYPLLIKQLLHTPLAVAPEQILYTLNHSKAKAVFVNLEFLPILAAIRDKLETVNTFVLLADDAKAAVPEGFAGEYETLLAGGPAHFEFPDFDENTRATTFYTTGTTGLPKKADLKAYAEQGHLSKFGVPDQVRFVASLARTSVGKLNKRAMREALS